MVTRARQVRFAASVYLVMVFTVLLASKEARADSLTANCQGLYNVTISSDGPAGSLGAGFNGCGAVTWTDSSNAINLPNGDSSATVDRNYTLTFQADAGWQFSALQIFSSQGSWGGYYASYSESEGPAQITDLASNSVATLGPWSGSGTFDASNGHEISSWGLGGPVSVVLPGSGFQFTVSSDITGATCCSNNPNAAGNLAGGVGNFYLQLTGSSTSAPVPEPSALLFLGTGFISLASMVKLRLRK